MGRDLDLDRFERDGFVVVRGLIDASQVDDVARAFDRLQARVADLEAGDHDLDGARFVLGPGRPPVIRRVVWCGAAEPELLAVGRCPAILDLAAQLLGRSELVQLINQAHFKLPGDGVRFPWHQDAEHRRHGTPLWHDVDGRGSFVEIAVAVDPMTPDNGGLRLVPGSHADGVRAHVRRELPAPADFVSPVLDPGDALAFGPFVVHGSPANHSDRPRRTLLNGFALPGANGRIYPGCGLGAPVHAPGLGRRTSTSSR